MVWMVLAIAVFYAGILGVGVGAMVVATGSSALLVLRRRRFPPLLRTQLVVTIVLAVAGAAAMGIALTWFGWVGTNLVAAALDPSG